MQTPEEIESSDDDVRLIALHLAFTSGRQDIVLTVLEELTSYPTTCRGYQVFAVNLQFELGLNVHDYKDVRFLEAAIAYASASGYEHAVLSLIETPNCPLTIEDNECTLLDLAIQNKQTSLARTLYERGCAYDCHLRGAFMELLNQQGVQLEQLLAHGIIPEGEIGTHWTISGMPSLSESDCWSGFASRRSSEELLIEFIRAHGAWGTEGFNAALSPDGTHFAMVVGAFIGVFGVEDGTEATFPQSDVLDGKVTVQFTADSGSLVVGSSQKPILYNFHFREPGVCHELFFDFTRFVAPGEGVIGFELSSYGGWLLMYQRKSGVSEINIFDVREPKLLKSLSLPDIVASACFSPDGERILFEFREVVTLWQWRAEVDVTRTFPIGRAIFLTSDELIFYGNSLYTGRTRLKSIENEFPDVDFSWSVRSLASSGDKSLLATHDGRDIYVYDSRTGELKSIIMEEVPVDDESRSVPRLGNADY
jgi:hypothetical protein